MANFNYRDPRYQRDIQRANAKASATGNRPKTEAITGKHAAYQFGRQLQFQGLALQKGMKGIQHELNLARINHADKMYGIREQRFKLRQKIIGNEIDQEKENMDWTIGLGLGTLGLATLEGRRRANAVKESLAQKQEFLKEYQNRTSKLRTSNIFGAVDDYSTIGLHDNI